MAAGSIEAVLNPLNMEMSMNICVDAVITLLPYYEALAITADQIARLQPFGFTPEKITEILSIAMTDSSNGIQKTSDNRYYIRII